MFQSVPCPGKLIAKAIRFASGDQIGDSTRTCASEAADRHMASETALYMDTYYRKTAARWLRTSHASVGPPRSVERRVAALEARLRAGARPLGRWCAETGAAGFTKATVQAYRVALETSGLAASSINVRLSAIRKLAARKRPTTGCWRPS
jgi:hypothetical protein